MNERHDRSPGIPIELSDERLPEHLVEIGAPDAWRAGFRGDWVRVAVVDSGIDTREMSVRRHLNERPKSDDFAYNETWDPDQETYDPNRVPRGGGYAQSEHRYDFIDEYGHGTKMAGIIGARPGFDGVFGLVPRVELFNCRVVKRDGTIDPEGLRVGVEALFDKRHPKIRVALFSLDQGVWRDRVVTREILKALDKGDVLAVIAASDTPSTTPGELVSGLDLDVQEDHPAFIGRDLGVENLLVVAAHGLAENGRLELTPTSNRGRRTVHLTAPGRGIPTVSPMAPVPAYGTSAAAALVAGAAALLAGKETEWAAREVRKVRDRIIGACRPPVPRLRSAEAAGSHPAARDPRTDIAQQTVSGGVLDLSPLTWGMPPS